MKTATYGCSLAKERLILATAGVANLIQLMAGRVNEPWNVVRCWRLDAAGRIVARISYKANFVYTTVPKVYTALLSRL